MMNEIEALEYALSILETNDWRISFLEAQDMLECKIEDFKVKRTIPDDTKPTYWRAGVIEHNFDYSYPPNDVRHWGAVGDSAVVSNKHDVDVYITNCRGCCSVMVTPITRTLDSHCPECIRMWGKDKAVEDYDRAMRGVK